MLNKAKLYLILLLLPINACIAQPIQTDQTNDCSYPHAVITVIAPINNASVVSDGKGADPSSLEHTVTHTIEYKNGDIAVLEQKYCSMYNFEVTYRIKQLTEKSFSAALSNIDQLIPKVKQDYRLVAPLDMIVNREMNEHQLSIESAFTRGLPQMAARSDNSVEHFIRFQPATGDSEATLTFTLGLVDCNKAYLA